MIRKTYNLFVFLGRLLFGGYHDYTMNVWDTLKVCENLDIIIAVLK